MPSGKAFMLPDDPRIDRSPARHISALGAAIFLALSVTSCATDRHGDVLFVAENGSDLSESASESAPLATIQMALSRAESGDTIRILPGTYHQDFVTVRSGHPEQPIRVVGERDGAGRAPVIRGGGGHHVIDIRHSHFWLEDLVVDGLVGDPSQVDAYRSKLVYVLGEVFGEKDHEPGITDVRLLRSSFRNAGTECVRLKFEVTQSEVAENLFENCGVWDFRFDRGQKNGEALYVGTAPEQLPENYPDARDLSRNNWIHHNWFRTNGAECIDIKEGASNNIIENNECTGQKDPDSGGISVRGDHNIVRRNRVHGNIGAGIRLGGDASGDAIQNEIVENQVFDNRVAAFKIMSHPQARICGNRVWNQDMVVRGTDIADVDPERKC